MSRTIELRGLPEDLHGKLEARAALAGLPLSDYLLAELRRLLERPTPEELRSKLRSLPASRSEDPAVAVRAERIERGERLDRDVVYGIRDDNYERYERFRLCRRDLLEAKRYLELILKERYFRSRPRAVRALAAYTAFVVSYSRPFSVNKDRRGKRLRGFLKDLGAQLAGDERALHDEIIEERNTLVAHSDASRRQITLHSASLSVHKGISAGIGSESRFRMALALVERHLATIEAEIHRLEPFQKAKAEKRGSYPPVP